MTKILSFVVFVFILASCGTKNKEAEKGKEEKIQEINTSDTPVKQEEIKYDSFTVDKLSGKWKVIEANGYSMHEMKSKIYEFTKDKATIYKTYGEGGMVTLPYIIENGELKVTEENKTPDGGVSKMTSKYKGGFFEAGKKLKLDNAGQITVLEKN